MSVATAPGGQTTPVAAPPRLRVQGVRAGFGSQEILHGIDLEVAAGEVAAIFGLNGAGKSVTLKVLAGIVPARAGRIEIDGHDVTHLGAEERVAHGVATVPQGRQVFAELTVEQNLRLGGYRLRRRDRARYRARLEEVLERFPVLARRRHQIAGTMSGGEQASLAVARALMSEPRLLLVDEPSAGLAPSVVEELYVTLSALHREGMTIVLVEQNVGFGLRLADTAHLMRRGIIVSRGPVASLDRDRVASELGIGRLASRRRGDETSPASHVGTETPTWPRPQVPATDSSAHPEAATASSTEPPPRPGGRPS